MRAYDRAWAHVSVWGVWESAAATPTISTTSPSPRARVAIREEPIGRLAEVSTIPASFVVERVMTVTPTADGFALTEDFVADPWVKDYDAIPGEGPASWARRFDVSSWGLLAAGDGDRWAGAAVVAHDTPGLDMLAGRTDLAVLWDLRVRPEARRTGIGRQLFRATEAWARQRGCRTLHVETQDINVPACRLYRHMGCELKSIDRHAYPDLPDEAQLIWSKPLDA